MSEVNFKKDFCEKYFDKGTWELDVLNRVDVLLKSKKGKILLYIESKYIITNETKRREALAQVILTNYKQKEILSHVALIYRDSEGEKANDILEFIDCSENSIMHNNDINWEKEKASLPSKDAIDRINDRLNGHIKIFKNDEIKEFYSHLKKNEDIEIVITEKNVHIIYGQWKNEVVFKEKITDEQDLINLFLVDILNGTRYKKEIEVEENVKMEEDLIREGTNLSLYELMIFSNKVVDGIKYSGKFSSSYYTIADKERYSLFWKKYKRPPEKETFLKILEYSARLYSEKYRKDVGGEYTPTCFVEKQNEILNKYYNIDDFIIFDPCAGVGNLENQFGKDFKQFCYLSTLEQMDVDICQIKGFENAIQFDYLRNKEQPKWKHKGTLLDINEICKRENKKLMIIMNPPYKIKEGFKYDLVIEFFIKVLDLKPDVIVYYCKTEFFFRDTVSVFVNSNYKIMSHIFSNAKETFKLSEWSISQIIFDKENGEIITGDYVTVDRYDYDKKEDKLIFAKKYTYDNIRPNLIKEIKQQIKDTSTGLILGQWVSQSYCIVVSNRQGSAGKITTNNLKYCLMLKGIEFNTHPQYFETSTLTYKGFFSDISEELMSDSIMFSLFYKGCNFSNKEGHRNYFIPFTAEELGCNKNDLNVLFPDDNPTGTIYDCIDKEKEKPFDFREFLKQFSFSEEARNLYLAALEIVRFYHKNDKYMNKDWNDSFYDITNTIMGKTPSDFKEMESSDDTRITRVKTTGGTLGFGAKNIRFVVNSEYLPIFYDFFEKREILAKKINKQLVEQGLLLWERENIW